MKSIVLASFSGGLFGVGLIISGMTRPEKVIGFLDVTGRWDPSLALVMMGAVGVLFLLHRLIVRRTGPLLGGSFQLPTRQEIDSRLVIGAAVFGVGWGLAGYCPGPGLVAAGTGSVAALVFMAGMTLGILVEHAVARPATARSTPQ
jgi:uncharacterized protein